MPEKIDIKQEHRCQSAGGDSFLFRVFCEVLDKLSKENQDKLGKDWDENNINVSLTFNGIEIPVHLAFKEWDRQVDSWVQDEASKQLNERSGDMITKLRNMEQDLHTKLDEAHKLILQPLGDIKNELLIEAAPAMRDALERVEKELKYYYSTGNLIHHVSAALNRTGRYYDA